MSVFTLQANHHVAVPLIMGLLTGPRFRCDVESEDPTSAFLTDVNGVSAFRNNSTLYMVYASSPTPATVHRLMPVFFPQGVPLYLVIVNNLTKATAVHYEVRPV